MRKVTALLIALTLSMATGTTAVAGPGPLADATDGLTPALTRANASVSPSVASRLAPRISGASAIDTAVAVAGIRAYPPGGTVYLANDRSAADALAAGPVAAVANAPILLTEPGSLPVATAKALAALAPGKVVIQGGKAAVSPSVMTAVQRVSPQAKVTRNSGPSAIDTAVVTASNFTKSDTVFIANDRTFSDALAGSAVAGSLAAPLMLVSPEGPVSPSVIAEVTRLQAKKIVLLGGRFALAPTVANEFALLGTVTRLAGLDAVATSVKIANFLPGRAFAALATVHNFSDALAVAPVAARESGVILLSGSECIATPAADWLRTNRVPWWLVGGKRALGLNVAQGISCSGSSTPVILTGWGAGVSSPTASASPNSAATVSPGYSIMPSDSPSYSPTPSVNVVVTGSPSITAHPTVSDTPSASATMTVPASPTPTVSASPAPTPPIASPVPSPSTTASPPIYELLANQPNQNITHYLRDEGHRTVLWVKGITPPDFADFKEVVDGAYRYEVTPWRPGQGWYDADKRLSDTADDSVLCSAAVAANHLHWWLDQNRAGVDRFLENPANGVITSQTHGRIDLRDIQHFNGQQDSGIYSLFVRYFGPSGSPVFADHTADLFLNGYAAPGIGLTNIEDNFTADDRGGFFYPILGKTMLTDRSSVKRYTGFELRVRQWLSEGRAVAVSHTTLNALLGHIITIWGAEFSDAGRVTAIYATDSDDRHATPTVLAGQRIGMKRIEVRPDSNGLTRLTTQTADNTGAKALELMSVRAGTQLWANLP